jgi:hypothetical protein
MISCRLALISGLAAEERPDVEAVKWAMRLSGQDVKIEPTR